MVVSLLLTDRKEEWQEHLDQQKLPPSVELSFPHSEECRFQVHDTMAPIKMNINYTQTCVTSAVHVEKLIISLSTEKYLLCIDMQKEKPANKE